MLFANISRLGRLPFVGHCTCRFLNFSNIRHSTLNNCKSSNFSRRSWSNFNRRTWSRPFYQESNRQRFNHSGRGAASGGFLLAGFWTTLKLMLGVDVDSPYQDKEISEQIKAAIAAVIDQKYDEAFDILHHALKIAQDKQNFNGENYVVDMMANLYYQKGDFDASERLFAELMRRLLSTGTPPNDPAIIEISLKLSDLYARRGDDEKAELGFQFCVENAKQHVVKKSEHYETKMYKSQDKSLEDVWRIEKETFSDPYALYGMVLETYAQYLVSRKRAAESVDYINRALELSREVYGALSGHSITVMNNFAVCCMRHGAYEQSAKFLKDIVDRASLLSQFADDMPGYLCNYAESLWHVDKQDEAIEMATKGVALAKESKNERLIMHAEEFLHSLKNDYKRKRKK